MSYMAECELCNAPGGELLWQDEFCRVILVNDMDYPGFCRVILNRHVKEMSDLEHAERERLMTVVFLIEQAAREVLQPQKINLASLGNKTPHLHWHVIPRFEWDKTFPNPIWAEPVRQIKSHVLESGTVDKLKITIQKLLG